MSEKFDADLLDASKEAMTTGCIMPLLKKELWLKIQSRRLKEGKEELVVPPTLPLSHQVRCLFNTGDFVNFFFVVVIYILKVNLFHIYLPYIFSSVRLLSPFGFVYELFFFFF